ncbi:hypothetical protein C6570_14985 [Ottowia oryzae]|uniref:Uncharacterized protein n=1 Tax=Ottowia oryzae TaxID=2109914 RepID=A0A2S0MHL4_9BURK|nr:hypothetical protein C6570_14985 [Ottowia oryzae]
MRNWAMPRIDWRWRGEFMAFSPASAGPVSASSYGFMSKTVPELCANAAATGANLRQALRVAGEQIVWQGACRRPA